MFLGQLASSCKNQQFLPADYEGRQLSFGNGGGFSGAVTQFIIFENGQHYKKVGLKDSLIVLPRLKKRNIKEIFSEYEENKIGEKFLHFPGNRYYFIEMKKGKEVVRQTWGKPEYTPDEDLLKFYNLLNLAIKNREHEIQNSY